MSKILKALTGQLIQIVLLLDTTGSMGWLRRVMILAFKASIKMLLSVFPNVQIGIVVFGDDTNPDEKLYGYSWKSHDFSSDVNELCRWLDGVGNSLGGGYQANSELAFREARKFNWLPNSVKFLQLVSDEVPHDANFKHLDGSKCDWRFEIKQLRNMDVTIDAVQCFGELHGERCAKYYREVSALGGGLHLHQGQHDELEVVFMARVLNILSGGSTAADSPIAQYQQEVANQRRMTEAVEQIFATITGRKIQKPKPRKDGLVPVPAGQFVPLITDKDYDSVPAFLAANGFVTKKEDGGEPVMRLYRYTGTREGKKRTETVQVYKEVVLLEEKSGKYFNGVGARTKLGLSLTSDCKLTPDMIPAGYAVFIESTSPNRLAPEGTEVLVDQIRKPSSSKNPAIKKK